MNIRVPNYGNLEGIDSENWMLWLICFIVASVILGFICYVLYNQEKIGEMLNKLFSGDWKDM